MSRLRRPVGTASQIATMNEPENNRAPDGLSTPRQVASELNNLIQIISGTSELIENIWEGTEGSEKYFAMLRDSIARAEQVTADLAAQSNGARHKVVLQADLQKRIAIGPRPDPIRKTSILVVDDEPMVLSLFRRVLVEAGYELTCAESGFECLDLFRRDSKGYDLVLLDLAMPFMDGEETFQRLRRISDTVAVVLTSGFCEEERLARMMKAGLSGYLRKPLRNQQILTLVSSIVTATPAVRSSKAGHGIGAAVQQA